MNNHRLPRIVAIACLMTSIIAPAAFTASQEPLKSLSSLEVVDAHEQKVAAVFGLFQSSSGPSAFSRAVVVFEVDKQPFVVIVSVNAFLGTVSGPFFQSSNCSGPPLIADVPQSIIAQSAISAPGHTVYVTEPDATPQRFDSFQGTFLAQDGTCQPTGGGGITLLAARAVVDLDTLFTPPFSVR
jgi:hypothetical protein